jgi:uncharacterized glyoxalase superfamily metalloenzyme YdcJ
MTEVSELVTLVKLKDVNIKTLHAEKEELRKLAEEDRLKRTTAESNLAELTMLMEDFHHKM